jgi:hypothetical protein
MATQTPEFSPEPMAEEASDPVAQTMALLQPWIEYVPQQQRRLGLFIFFALLLHLTAFFFIRIDTTHAVLPHQTRIHVTVETPLLSTQEMISGDGFWDRLTDPRLFLLPVASSKALDADIPPIDFSAINSSFGARQLPIAADVADLPFNHQAMVPLEQRVATTLNPARQPFAYNEAPRPAATKTTWQCDPVLAERQPAAMPDLPAPIADTDLSPTELRVAVSGDGAVQHVFVEPSWGSDGGSSRLDLDQQAILAAHKIRFKRAEHPGLVWGRITVFWQDTAKPREEVIATPPTTSP